MKSLLILLISLFVFTISQNLRASDEDIHGCIIPEGDKKCCWRNRNGCCAPASPRQICTQAFKTCCKTKYYDEETKTYKYKYN